jgi:hypothetical protein
MLKQEEKLARLLNLLDTESLSRQEFVENFKQVIDFVRKANDSITAYSKSESEKLIAMCEKSLASVESKNSKDFESWKKETNDIVKDQLDNMYGDWDKLQVSIRERIAELKDGENADEERVAEMVVARMPAYKEKPEETPGIIRDKLETLKGEDRLDVSAIKGIDDLIQRLPNGDTRIVSGGSRHLQIQSDGTVIDRNARVINFKGTGITSIVRNSSGVIDVTIGGGTFVDNEIVSGSTTTFTLSQTPVAGTVHVYALGQRLTPGAGNDFTISGAVITTISSYPAGAILADYQV